MASKLSKAVVLYMDASEIGNRAGAECDKCIHYNSNGNCYILNSKVKPKGVCGLYINGPINEHDAQGKLSKETTGYIETGPTHCGSCKFYGGGAKSGPCKIVEGEVEFAGCCNSYEREAERDWNI